MRNERTQSGFETGMAPSRERLVLAQTLCAELVTVKQMDETELEKLGPLLTQEFDFLLGSEGCYLRWFSDTTHDQRIDRLFYESCELVDVYRKSCSLDTDYVPVRTSGEQNG